MSGKIPQDFIDELLTRVDIVEVIDRRVPLKKAGREFTARCPFHDERTPSFTVSPTKQFYHCFGCGANGTAISFLMNFAHLEFRDAVDELAMSAGLEVPSDKNRLPEYRDAPTLLQVITEANIWFKKQLRHHADAAEAIASLKNRGITGEIAARFELGFAPKGRDNLVTIAKGKPERLPLFIKAGLISRGDSGGYYDRFRSRVIFPIHDSRDQVVGFGGRILGEGGPKYLNSPETPVFHKGAELYNLHRARATIAKEKFSFVVEGYTDVLSLTQHGIGNAVATLGTATTSTHLRRLFRLAPSVVFCFDGDRAGRDAAWKALEIALPELEGRRQARFLFLPDGEDPDSLVQKQGAAAFRQLAKEASPLPDFLFDFLTKQTDLKQWDGGAGLAELAQPLLNKVPDGPLRELMQVRLVELSGVHRYTGGTATAPRRRRTEKINQERLSPLATAVSLLVQHPHLAKEMALPERFEFGKEIADKGSRLLREVHTIASQDPDISSAVLVERFRDQDNFRALEKLAAQNHLLEEDEVASFYHETIDTIEQQVVSSAITELLRRSTETGLDSTDKVQLAALYNRREILRAGRESA
jgi:DNA primase